MKLKLFFWRFLNLKNQLIKILKIIKKLKKVRIIIKQKAPRFVGWGMTTQHFPPWSSENQPDLVSREFNKIENDFRNMVKNNEFVMTNYQKDGVYYDDPIATVNELSWRHFIVYWSAKFAANSTNQSSFNFVEAGVCDGISINFAISALENVTGLGENDKIYLYDTWGPMKPEYLTPKESIKSGAYADLSIDQTRLNLTRFENNCIFVKGYIPEIFTEEPGPSKLSWLHIDLNSSMPTQKTLEQFAPKILSGGVILFDDYGWKFYRDTKRVADAFLSNLDGSLLPLPTGQAIFFKR